MSTIEPRDDVPPWVKQPAPQIPCVEKQKAPLSVLERKTILSVTQHGDSVKIETSDGLTVTITGSIKIEV